jgi:DNA-binding winged helix-turn-helix (wHTH) protein
MATTALPSEPRPSTAVRFGECVLDLDRREVRRAGKRVHLTTKAFDLLAFLVRERPRAVSKHEIALALWPETFVTEGNVSVLLAELRRGLGDDARAPRYLRTVHGYGLAFCAETGDAEDAPALCRLVAWGVREFSLGPGETLIGRDPACDVPIAVASLSRRHARIRIGPEAAVLEDLGSKNGCMVNGAHGPGPWTLADGDEIRLGSALLSFHWLTGSQSNATLTSPTQTL